MKKENCIKTTIGIIKELKSKGLNFPTIITVEYQVDGKIYKIEESIKLKTEKIKLGFLTIGQRKIPVMVNTTVGSKTNINYNPSNPQEAFITENVGKINI